MQPLERGPGTPPSRLRASPLLNPLAPPGARACVQATQFVSKPSCNTAVPLIPQCKYSRTSAASSKAKRDAALAPLKRTQHAGALFYRFAQAPSPRNALSSRVY